jgi:hypothetical protein
MILSQARSLGGGPPARNITFALRRSITQLLLSVTQPDATLEDFGGGKMAATNQPQRDHGAPLERHDNTGSLAMGGGGAAMAGFDNAIQKWGMRTKEASIAQDLKWQCDVDGDPQKTTQFKEVVGGLQTSAPTSS